MPKHNKNFKPHHYIKLTSNMTELTQANKMEKTLRAYQSLNLSSQDISYQEFNHLNSYQVELRPLELQYKININPNTGYLVKWQEIGYLFNFFGWSNYPQNQPFLGPKRNSKTFKITPMPQEDNKNISYNKLSI